MKYLSTLALFLFVILLAPGCKKESCDDGKMNQNETGIDCGGSCTPCPTCTDGKMNQGETGVDCGGPCTACATCSDGIQNQDETGVDCGGSCAACNYLCTGKPGSTDYMPLAMNNKWEYTGSGDYHWIVEGTNTINGTTYSQVEWYYNTTPYSTMYFRNASNGDLMTNISGTEYLSVPASPTVGQSWQYGSNTREVINVNGSATTSSCSYTGLVIIEEYDSWGNLSSTRYYKKGIGMVKQDGGFSITELDAVTFN